MNGKNDQSFRVYLIIIIIIPLVGYGGTYLYKSLVTLDSINCDYRINETTRHFEKMPEQERKECEGLKQFGFISSIGLLIPISVLGFILARSFVYSKNTNKIQKVKNA